MFIRQLNYLIALDKHRHFGRAAESCHVSQPALSNGIRELERELGIDFVVGDASDLDVLQRANAKAAKAVLALSDDDSDNAFVVLAAKELGGIYQDGGSC